MTDVLDLERYMFYGQRANTAQWYVTEVGVTLISRSETENQRVTATPNGGNMGRYELEHGAGFGSPGGIGTSRRGRKCGERELKNKERVDKVDLDLFYVHYYVAIYKLSLSSVGIDSLLSAATSLTPHLSLEGFPSSSFRRWSFLDATYEIRRAERRHV